jgi:hypothetical protein
VWELEGPLGMITHCHCSMCRKSHGVGYATYAGGAADTFRFVQGGDLIGRYESSPGNHRCFCARCGSKVPASPAGERVFVPLGNLDDDPGGRPEAHIFVGSKAPWLEITDDVPQFDVYPPGWPEPKIQRPEAAPPSRPDALRGSCLCGDVVFEVSGDRQGVVMCHCSRCRKGRSAAHGANFFLTSAEIEWIRGRDQVRNFKVPDAETFTNSFCGRCGSILPRDPGDGGLLGVPAGSLDTDPGLGGRLHIFVGSKAPWIEITDDLPQLAGRPGA